MLQVKADSRLILNRTVLSKLTKFESDVWGQVCAPPSPPPPHHTNVRKTPLDQ